MCVCVCTSGWSSSTRSRCACRAVFFRIGWGLLLGASSHRLEALVRAAGGRSGLMGSWAPTRTARSARWPHTPWFRSTMWRPLPPQRDVVQSCCAPSRRGRGERVYRCLLSSSAHISLAQASMRVLALLAQTPTKSPCAFHGVGSKLATSSRPRLEGVGWT